MKELQAESIKLSKNILQIKVFTHFLDSHTGNERKPLYLVYISYIIYRVIFAKTCPSVALQMCISIISFELSNRWWMLRLIFVNLYTWAIP